MIEQPSLFVDFRFGSSRLGRNSRRGNVTFIQSRLHMPVTPTERALAELVAQSRPEPIRAFDQIPMQTGDLARQAKRIAPLLANQRVAFVGDMDGTASLLGLIAAFGGPTPASLLVLDFDQRVLEAAEALARRFGFEDLLRTRLYNCFEPIPPDLLRCWDWFYVNPPYGSHNVGESARLFLTRGCESVQPGGSGCLILPDDPSRPWTRSAMLATQQFLVAHGWVIREKIDHLHHYHLDDDPGLSSSLLIVDLVSRSIDAAMPFAGRRVSMDEIPMFYGRNTLPPYPAGISRDGEKIMVGDSL
jgi:hypothetical protein